MQALLFLLFMLEVSALAAAMGDCNDLLTGVGEETWMQLQPLEAIASIVIVNDGRGKVNRPIECASCPSQYLFFSTTHGSQPVTTLPTAT